MREREKGRKLEGVIFIKRGGQCKVYFICLTLRNVLKLNEKELSRSDSFAFKAWVIRYILHLLPQGRILVFDDSRGNFSSYQVAM